MINATIETARKMKAEAHAEQRWQRALAHWKNLGFHSRVFALAARLMDEARKDGRKLDGGTAYHAARNRVETEGDLLGEKHGA